MIWIFCYTQNNRSTIPESWAANSFRKLHESLGAQSVGNNELKNEVVDTIRTNDEEKYGVKINRFCSNTQAIRGAKQAHREEKETMSVSIDTKKSDITNPFMQLTYAQKYICVGTFWETFNKEAENQGISSASFATFLGARAAIPGPSAPHGAWGQFSAGNRSVLDTFRKLRYGKFKLTIYLILDTKYQLIFK